MKRELIDKIFDMESSDFEAIALEVFRFQYENNTLYHSFSNALCRTPDTVQSLIQIPYLPIACFKSHAVASTHFEPQAIFESSGTTGTINSKHLVKDLDLYKTAFTKGFQHFYDNPSEWCIIGLLPSYLERQHSSLVIMVDELVKMSGHPQSGFYLNEYERLKVVLETLEQQGQKTLLIGVSFALLDFAELYAMDLNYVTLMETGGMKGRRKELVREELHAFIGNRLGVPAIHSEYGMTELLSQAYSSGQGLFEPSPWMKILLREEDDPLEVKDNNSIIAGSRITGLINVIDLANIYSCSFIATDDVGKLYSNGYFEVIGRSDISDLRGCSLMVAQF